MESLAQKVLNIRYFLYIITAATSCPAAAQIPEKLIPDAAVIQQGGSIGYLSVGLGYNIMKEKGSLDFSYGYVPKAKGGTLNILSAKFAYRPLTIRIKDKLTVYPVNPGFFVSYHLGKDFHLFWDKKQYSSGYYWWSTALRTHISFSNEIRLNTLKIFPRSKIRSFSLYSEFNTNDLYAVSWFKNRESMSLADIFKFGYGVRLYF